MSWFRVIIAMFIITVLCYQFHLNSSVYITRRYTATLSSGAFMQDDKLLGGHPLQRIIFERVEIKNEYEEFADLSFEPEHTRTSEVTVLNPPEPVKPKEVVVKAKKKTQTIETSVSDELLIEYIVQAEAGNTEDLDGCRLVCDVILNRVASSKFPNNVSDVIFQPGQFSTVKSIFDSTRRNNNGINVNDKVKEAVRMELTGARLDSESLFFARSPITSTGVYQHGRHYFSR